MRRLFFTAMFVISLSVSEAWGAEEPTFELAPRADSQDGSPSPNQNITGQTNVAEPQYDWHLAPTKTGGATASISGIDPAIGFAFALDAYYTPYGDDMTGGGGSLLLEGEFVGFRMTLAKTSGKKDSVEMEMDYLAYDLYFRRALVKNLFAYAGVGFALLNFDSEYTYHVGFYHGNHKWTESDRKVEIHGDSDPIFTSYVGIRWRFANPLYAFAEYRYDADADIDVGTDEKYKLEGGGRFVVGGGLMF